MRRPALTISFVVIGLSVSQSCGSPEELAPLWPSALVGGSVPTSCGDVTLSPSGEIFAPSAVITMTSSGQYIHYTTDGTTPTLNSLVYTGPVTVTQSATVKAVSSCGTVLGTNVASKTFSVFAGTLLYVSPSGDDTTGNGSQATPYATPGKAISVANSGSGIYNILVAAGNYTIAASLTVNSGRPVSIYGGYNPTDWSRDISTNTSRFVDTGSGVASTYFINDAVLITSELVIDGFTFDIGIFNAAVPATRRTPIEVTGASFVRISNNVINVDYQYGCNSAPGVSGIYLTPNTAFSLQRYRIYNNKINIRNSQGIGQGAGNSATFLRGIQTATYASSTALTLDIYNNVIQLPDISGVGLGNYYGIALNIDESNGAGSATDNKINVRNNTIIINGEVAASYATRAIAVSTKTDILNVENNIVYSINSVGLGLWVSQPGAAGYTPSVRNNNFFQLESPYATGGAIVLVPLATLNAQSFAMTSGLGTNLAYDLVDGANTYFTNETSDWSLVSGGVAAFTTFKAAGMNGGAYSFGFSTDINGATRTGSSGTGWSIGAYEQDQ